MDDTKVLVDSSTTVRQQLRGQGDTLPKTGTQGGKVHRRMRSRFQKGTLQTVGNQVIVRFRVDTRDGQRLLTSEHVCPVVDGKPTMTPAEQRRKAASIIEAAGVNNTTQIKQSVLGLTFAQQAEAFLKYSTTKNDPVSTNTAYTRRTTIDKWLTPNIGEMLLQDVKNSTARDLVQKMVKAGLSPKSIDNYINLMKLIVASAVDDEGEQIYPRKWNTDFINAPKVKKQHTPTFTPEEVSNIIAQAKNEQERVLLILAAATGLRLGELMGISVEDVTHNGKTITVRQQATRGKVTDRLKTDNAYRTVDAHSDVAAELAAFIGKRTTGLMFQTSTGNAINHSNFRNRVLYPILEKLGIGQAGAHAFRRFRVTHLRKQQAPEDLIQFWLGHASKSITDSYSQLKLDVEYRKTVAESMGIGFTIPVVQTVQNHEMKEISVAA
jgi:integrase